MLLIYGEKTEHAHYIEGAHYDFLRKIPDINIPRFHG